MNKRHIQNLKAYFGTLPEIKLVYFGGSQSRQEYGELSDYDFALYRDTRDKVKMHKIRIDTMVGITRLLKTDRIDVVVLNLTTNPDLKYLIIKEGRLIYSKEPFKVIFEPRIMNEYFDFHKMLDRHSLTKASA